MPRERRIRGQWAEERLAVQPVLPPGTSTANGKMQSSRRRVVRAAAIWLIRRLPVATSAGMPANRLPCKFRAQFFVLGSVECHQFGPDRDALGHGKVKPYFLNSSAASLVFTYSRNFAASFLCLECESSTTPWASGE